MKNETKINVLSEIVRNDHTALYNSEYTYPWNGSKADMENIKPGECYFASHLLQFGDYDNSCNVERSNVRVFLEEFKGHKDIIHRRGAYSSESILIDVLCEDTEIIETLQALENYPALNDEDCSLMEMEIEEEAWDGYIERDFLTAIEKHYKADQSDIKDDDKLFEFYNELKETTNTYFQLEAGGNGYIDIKRLIEALPETAPEFLNLEYWD